MWTSILLSAVCAGLATLTAGTVISKPKELPIPYVVVLVVAFLGLNWLANGYAAPFMKGPTSPESTDTAVVDTMLSEFRLYGQLERRDAEMYAEVREHLTRLVQTSANEVEARRRGFEYGRRLIGDMFLSHAPRADDQSLAALAPVVFKALRQLDDRDPIACHDWVFGGRRQLDAIGIVDQSTQDELLDSMTDVIESATLRPNVAMASETEMQELFRGLMDGSEDTEGMLMGGSGAPLDARTKAASCHTAVEVYARIRALPVQRAGPVLRSLFRRA